MNLCRELNRGQKSHWNKRKSLFNKWIKQGSRARALEILHNDSNIQLQQRKIQKWDCFKKWNHQIFVSVAWKTSRGSDWLQNNFLFQLWNNLPAADVLSQILKVVLTTEEEIKSEVWAVFEWSETTSLIFQTSQWEFPGYGYTFPSSSSLRVEAVPFYGWQQRSRREDMTPLPADGVWGGRNIPVPWNQVFVGFCVTLLSQREEEEEEEELLGCGLIQGTQPRPLMK